MPVTAAAMNVSHCARTLTPPSRANAGFDSNRNRSAAHWPTAPPATAVPNRQSRIATITAMARSVAGTAASCGTKVRMSAYVRWIAGGF